MTMSQSRTQGGGPGLMLRAFSSRNYRLFFCGQLVSLIGTWLTNVATSWLVYRLTHDTLMLGIVSFSGQIPAFLLAPAAGVLVDRWNLHRTLVVTQTLSMLQSAALAILTLTHIISVPWILVLYVAQGLINAVDIPARQAFVFHMVDRREDLPNAIALNSAMFNAARLLGPPIGGVLIALFGEGLCYSIDAISYVGVIAALLMMHVAPQLRHAGRKHVLTELREGLRYAFHFAPIRMVLVNLAVATLAAVPYTVLMPVFAGDILGGGPRILGVLMAAAGLGAMAGGIRLAARRSVLGLGEVIPMAGAGLGLALIGFGLSPVIWLSVPLVAMAGFCMITQTAASNTVLQTVVEDDKRGRVMSLFAMAFQGTMPLGSLLAGSLAKSGLGAPGTVVAGGLGCLLAAALFARRLPMIRRLVRPIYVQRGILSAPEADESAALEGATAPAGAGAKG